MTSTTGSDPVEEGDDSGGNHWEMHWRSPRQNRDSIRIRVSLLIIIGLGLCWSAKARRQCYSNKESHRNRKQYLCNFMMTIGPEAVAHFLPNAVANAKAVRWVKPPIICYKRPLTITHPGPAHIKRLWCRNCRFGSLVNRIGQVAPQGLMRI
jgi:hypothetical protein